MDLRTMYMADIEAIIWEIRNTPFGVSPNIQRICAKHGRPNLSDFTEDEIDYIERACNE